ncbi:NifB/NifX family molybdenum-iron cluster-binding protein, partial [Candidatus Omnitrophota bacterium]
MWKDSMMKICIPTENDEGLKAKVFDHFGSAPYFTIYDGEEDAVEIVDNAGKDHVHGKCHPLAVIGRMGIDAVVCRGMGLRALQGLAVGGIKAYRAEVKTVEEIIRQYKDNRLREISIEDA